MPTNIRASSFGARAVVALLGLVIGLLTLADAMAQQVSGRPDAALPPEAPPAWAYPNLGPNPPSPPNVPSGPATSTSTVCVTGS